MSNPFGLILRFLLKLVLGLFAAVFAVSLMLAALIWLAVSLLKSLITGRKTPAPVIFGRFQKFSPEAMWPGQRSASPHHNADNVVDVEAHEVRDVRDVRGDNRLH